MNILLAIVGLFLSNLSLAQFQVSPSSIGVPVGGSVRFTFSGGIPPYKVANPPSVGQVIVNANNTIDFIYGSQIDTGPACLALTFRDSLDAVVYANLSIQPGNFFWNAQLGNQTVQELWTSPQTGLRYLQTNNYDIYSSDALGNITQKVFDHSAFQSETGEYSFEVLGVDNTGNLLIKYKVDAYRDTGCPIYPSLASDPNQVLFRVEKSVIRKISPAGVILAQTTLKTPVELLDLDEVTGNLSFAAIRGIRQTPCEVVAAFIRDAKSEQVTDENGVVSWVARGLSRAEVKQRAESAELFGSSIITLDSNLDVENEMGIPDSVDQSQIEYALSGYVYRYGDDYSQLIRTARGYRGKYLRNQSLFRTLLNNDYFRECSTSSGWECPYYNFRENNGNYVPENFNYVNPMATVEAINNTAISYRESAVQNAEGNTTGYVPFLARGNYATRSFTSVVSLGAVRAQKSSAATLLALPDNGVVLMTETNPEGYEQRCYSGELGTRPCYDPDPYLQRVFTLSRYSADFGTLLWEKKILATIPVATTFKLGLNGSTITVAASFYSTLPTVFEFDEPSGIFSNRVLYPPRVGTIQFDDDISISPNVNPSATQLLSDIFSAYYDLDGNRLNAIVPGPIPVLNSVSIPSAPYNGGVSITLQGSSFEGCGVRVFFAGYECKSTAGAPAQVSTDGTSITCLLPAIPIASVDKTVDITVRNPDGRTAKLVNSFTYLMPPAISSVTPNSVFVGENKLINIAGSNFKTATTVTIGSAACVIQTRTPNSIVCKAPNLPSGVYSLLLRNSPVLAKALANAVTYQVYPAATISSFTPSTVSLTGGLITITGANFYPGTKVKLGSAFCPEAQIKSLTQITCQAPAIPVLQAAEWVRLNPTGKESRVWALINPAGLESKAATKLNYQLPALSIQSFSPAGLSAAGGLITVKGTGFLGASSGLVGTKVCTSLQVLSDTELKCTAPSNSNGTSFNVGIKRGAVTVLSGTKLNYDVAPVVSSISPKSLLITKTGYVTITGTGLFLGLKIFLGDKTCAVKAVNKKGDSATCLAASSPLPKRADVIAISNKGVVGALANGFDYLNTRPTISRVFGSAYNKFPANVGNGALKIIGTGFNLTSKVFLGAAGCLLTSVNSAGTEIRCKPASTPAGVSVDVQVENPGIGGGKVQYGSKLIFQ